MAGLLGAALCHLDDALSRLGTNDDQATVRRCRHRRPARAGDRLLGRNGWGCSASRVTRRELYRRTSRIGEP